MSENLDIFRKCPNRLNLLQGGHALMIFQMWNGAWNQIQFKVCQVAQASVAYSDKHSTLDPVMVSVVNSIPSGGRQPFTNFFFKPLDVNSGLKCKCDLAVNILIVAAINSIPW